MYLSKDDIFKADDLPVEDVDVPEWGGVVRVRGLTGKERDRFEFKMAAARKDPASAQVRAEIVGRCIVDEDGDRVFSDRDIDRLGDKSGEALDRVFEKVRELSGMGDDAVEEAAADLDPAPDGSSPSV